MTEIAIKPEKKNQSVAVSQPQQLNHLLPIPAGLNNQVSRDILENANNPRIYSVNDILFPDKANQTILRIIAALSIENPPLGPAKEFVIYAFRHKFNMLSFEEIELAFKLNACGEWPTIEHYQQFNIEFVGKVLNQYKKRKEITLEDIKPMLQLQAPIELSSEQKAANYKLFLETICKDFENYKTNPDKEILLSDIKYLELEERGIIRLELEEKKEFKQRSSRIYLAELKRERTQEFKTVAIAFKNMTDEAKLKDGESRIKSIARELVMKRYFFNWNEQNFDLKAKLLPNG